MTTYLTSINNRAEVIEKTLIDLGYQLSDRGKYWQCNAIYRDGDNRTALQIWKDTGIWKDFVANTTYQPFKRLLELTCNDDSKIQEILHSIKNNNDPFIQSTRTPKMESDQFLNADITLKEIQSIKKVLKQKLANMFHLRIEYPD